jgi:rod shape-determining protein MreD
MAIFVGFPLLIFAVILQITLMPQLRLLGGAPDLIFLLVISWALKGSFQTSVIWAFIGGVALDLMSIQPLGTSTLGMLIVIYGMSGLGNRLYRVGFFVLMGVVLIGTIVMQLCIVGVLFITGHPTDWGYAVTDVMMPTLFYNAVTVWPIYGFIRILQIQIERRGGFSLE